MRYTDGTKNNDVTAVVRADSYDCPELRRSNAGSVGQCWIAVKSGQKISVFCDLKLEASQYQVDLVVDGVLRNIAASTVCPKHEDREEVVEFYEGNHKHHRSLFRSPMVTSRMPERGENQGSLVFDDSDNTRVGTIEVFVYKYDMGYNHTRAAELPENVVDWEDLEGPAGCAGIEPTHEVVMETTRRLNDTERRTWKNKSEKLPMGHVPWASFKFLYRHETALQDAQLINPRLNVVPTADGLSSLKKGLLSFYTSSGDDDRSQNPRFNNNPWIVRERNGLREYKQLDITPSKPGPQIISTKRVPKRPRDTKKGTKPATRRSSRLEDKDLNDHDYEESVDGSSVGTPSKRAKPNVAGLRAEVEQLQIKRDEACRELEEQTKAGAIQLNQKEERTLLVAHKEALQREIGYVNLHVEKYKTRRAVFEELNNPLESADASDDDAMIDPALLTPEPNSSKMVMRSPAVTSCAVEGVTVTESSTDGSISGSPNLDGATLSDDSNTSDDSMAVDAASVAAKDLVIVDDDMAIGHTAATTTPLAL